MMIPHYRHLLCALYVCLPTQGFVFRAPQNINNHVAVRTNPASMRLFLTSTSSNNGHKSNSSSAIHEKGSKVSTRLVAARALMGETATGKHATFSLRKLENDNAFQRLDLRDRGFTRLLVSTVERRNGQIDKILSHCMKDFQKLSRRKSDSLVQAALRIGAAQLLFLRTPSHAAVKETVDVLRLDPQIKVPNAKVKLVNAVLRRIDREGKDLLETITAPYDNLAPWLQAELRSTYGEEKFSAITEAFMMEPPVYLSANHALGATPDEKEAKLQDIQNEFESHGIEDDTIVLGTAKADILPHGSIFIDKQQFPGAVSRWPLYDQGEWWVQDASASLPAIALCNSLLSQDASTENARLQHAVDLCAAPGGKTAQLLSLGFPTVTAIEFSAKRAKQLQSNMERLHLEERCQVVVADGSTWIPPQGKESINAALLDVPCTATGTASRRPDVLRRDADFNDILETQYKLATHCADNILASGGVMVYATCSLLKQESEEQVQKLLTRKHGARLKTVPILKGEIPGFDDAIDDNGWLRVIPGWLPGKLGRCDGFFVARLRKE